MYQMIIPIFLPEAGCSGRCVFCDQRRISGTREIIPPEAVYNLIDTFLATNPRPQAQVEVAFFGGTFTALPRDMQEKYLQAAEGFRKSGKVSRLRVSTRPDRITADNIKMLRDYGVWLVELGIQSLDDQVLKAAKRGYRRNQVKAAIDIIKAQGLHFGAQLMPGLPGASRSSDVESAYLCAQWGCATARIYPTLVLADTELEQMMMRGEYWPLSLDVAIEVSADMYQCFIDYGIPVIRMGLQASTSLETPGQIIAGPWHPAFGELVKSRIWRRMIDDKLQGWSEEEPVEVLVSRKFLSQARGQHNCNLSWLEQRYKTKISISGNDMLHYGQIIVKKCGGMPK